MSISASGGLYIKLGGGGAWDKLCFSTSTLRLGFKSVTHEIALRCAQAGDFSPVKQIYENEGTLANPATRFANEVRRFYTAASDVIWVTF
jgi:hypothetical protein